MLLNERGVFKLLGTEQTQRLVVDIIRLSDQYDCNSGEILDGLAQVVGVCEWCAKAKTDLEEGHCAECRAKYSDPDEDEPSE